MPTSVNHHIGLRVADMDRATAFYREVFGAQVRTAPMGYGPPDAADIFAGPPDLGFRVTLLGFDDGVVELFEFAEPHRTADDLPVPDRGILHYAITVDDVDAALDRVLRAGGARLWKEPLQVAPDARVMYVTDPDGHVIELIDVTSDRLIEIINESIDAGAPPPGAGR